MNKQQLASKIWESANKMRSKIEANEYKDYILGFIFYKYLSENEIKLLKSEGIEDKELENIKEEDESVCTHIKQKLGYFISYENLFSTWLKKGSDFNVQNVRDAISAFNRLINPSHKKVFTGIFDTLSTGLSKLGDTAQNQEKYKKEYDAMIKTYDETKFKYEQLEIESSQQAAKHQMIKDYINTLKKQNKPLTKFDGLMWGSLLESATIKDKDTIVFKFKDGTEING